jgi:hypothetical protein
MMTSFEILKHSGDAETKQYLHEMYVVYLVHYFSEY